MTRGLPQQRRQPPLRRQAVAVAIAATSAGWIAPMTASHAGAVASVPPAAAASGSGATRDRRLDQSASPSQRAAQSVMQSVANAGNRLVAAGERGLVVYSDDCGGTWKQAQVPVSVTLVALKFIDEKRGWAVGHGGVVLATDDGGATWRKQIDGRDIARIALAAAKDAAAARPGEETARAVKDAERLVADGPDKPLFAVHFWTPQRGLVVGAYGIALSSEDGGASWQWIADRIPNPKGLHVYGLWTRENLVFLAGEQGLVLRSDDGGRRFQPVTSPYAGSFFGLAPVAGPEASDLFIYGLRGNAFRLSIRDNSMQRIDIGSQASLLKVLSPPAGLPLAFDADGRIVELREAPAAARSLGNSPVGPVIGAAAACDKKVALAGFRGVAMFERPAVADATAKAGAK